jgi:hypothetical protein
MRMRMRSSRYETRQRMRPRMRSSRYKMWRRMRARRRTRRYKMWQISLTSVLRVALDVLLLFKNMLLCHFLFSYR